MARLKIAAIADNTPVKLSVALPAAVHRDLVCYAQAVARETGQNVEPTQLVAPMLMRFMATDRAFAKWRRGKSLAEIGTSSDRNKSGPRAGESTEG